MNKVKHPYRVFICYSHDDRELVERVDEMLTSIGLVPVWDKSIMPGTRFTSAIKERIKYAHILMPLLTENSAQRPWVHQETGYALALNIPVLPVAVGRVPGQMIAELHAIEVDEDLSGFAEKVADVDFESLIFSPQIDNPTAMEVTAWQEERTEFLVRYASRVIELGHYGKIRQLATLSSFSIPDLFPDDPLFVTRGGEHDHYSDYLRSLLQQERQVLERHALECGCDLIVDPSVCFERHGTEGTEIRLRVLLEFLEKMTDDKAHVIISPEAGRGNVTIVGDWFSAELMVTKRGEPRTVFSWNAPTVLGFIRWFDRIFNDSCRKNNVSPDESRIVAIEQIRETLVDVEKYFSK